MKPTPSKKLASLPPYLFMHLAALKKKAEASGLSVIDLGQGSPDLPSPPHVVAALKKSIDQPWTHRYPNALGLPKLREAIADWYKKRFNVSLNPETEVLPLIGSKEGIAHLLMALIDPGDAVLVPSPCYPVHYNGVVLAGGRLEEMPLLEENGFIPDLSKIPEKTAQSAKVMLLNYPNNPTGAILPSNKPLQDALDFAKRYGSLIAYDNAYSELTFDGYRAPSILELPGAKEHAVEFHSLSKSYSMAGWRIGFVVGNAEAIANLSKLKGFLDYGIPSFIQEAAIAALSGPQDCVTQAAKTYQSRRDVLIKALASIGWKAPAPKATMYIWTRLPESAGKIGSLEFCERLILEHGVVIAPGVGFGKLGEGFVRISLIADALKLEEAARRIGTMLASYSVS